MESTDIVPILCERLVDCEMVSRYISIVLHNKGG